MATYSYKCPNCSAPLTYNPNKNKLSCDYCKSEFTIDEINKYIKENPDLLKEQENNKNEEASSDGYNEKLKGYNCQSCGADVVTTDTTMTTFCYYCHNPVVITDRVVGDFKPDKIIPFKIDKKKAEETLVAWAKRKRYIKKDFYSQSQLEKITGIYLPYWGIDSKFDIRLKGKGFINKTYTRSNYQYTDTSEYLIDRSGEFEVNNINELAYNKVDKALISSITPYDYKELVDFRTFYLNGFFSETYDTNFNTLESSLNGRAESYLNASIKNSLSQYNSTNLQINEKKLIDSIKHYTLLPVWLMTYDYKGEKYIYALNGQTGIAFGELPIDDKLIMKDSAIISIVFFLLILLGGAFIW